MAVATMFSNTHESFQQQVNSDVKNLKEFNAPSFNAFRMKVEKQSSGEKGYKIVYDNLIAGGHTTPSATRPDWNEPVADEEIASYVYPVRYRLPIIFDHAVLRDFKNQVPGAARKMARLMKGKMLIALKRLNRNMPGDGSGYQAFSATTTTVLGSQSISGETTPSSSVGHTKGTKWLRKNNFYQAINTSTGLPRGLFSVTTEGATSITVNVISGTVSSGDPIVDMGTYNGWFRGFGHLISGTNRIVQGINTADFPDLNSYVIDLALAPLSFATIEDLVTGLSVRNNDGGKNGKVLFMTPGQGSILRKSGQNLRIYNDGSNVVKGISEDIDFGTNITAILDADLDEDRVEALVYNEFGMLEEMELDDMSMDGQVRHQLMGANNTGSERYQQGIGWDGNFFRRGNALSSALIKRASVTGVIVQSGV